MNQLLLATTNPGKFKEISEAIKDLALEIRSLKAFSNLKPIEETGKTFEENAVLKARGYGGQTHLPTLADDGGLEIEFLDGEPGVKSHRWPDENREATEQELINYTLEKLKGVPWEKRKARLRTVVALYLPDDNRVFTEIAFVEGYIVEKLPEEIMPGYPFRSLFFLPQFGKLYKDLTEEEHRQINHRLKAVEKLKPIIRKKVEAL